MATLKLLNQERDITGSIGDVALTLPGTGEEPESVLRLSSFQDRILVLLVLGVTCKHCKHVAIALSEILPEYASEVSIVGVCVQSGCAERLPEFAPGAEIHFPLAACRLRDLCPALGIAPSTWLFYPTLIFIDREQRLRGLFISGDSFFEDVEKNMRSALGQLLAEVPAEISMEATR